MVILLLPFFEKGGGKIYDFTKSVFIRNDGKVRWHFLFNHKPNERTVLATQSVSFLLRIWKSDSYIHGLVFSEPLTASDKRLFVRTSFYNCNPIQ